MWSFSEKGSVRINEHMWEREIEIEGGREGEIGREGRRKEGRRLEKGDGGRSNHYDQNQT